MVVHVVRRLIVVARTSKVEFIMRVYCGEDKTRGITYFAAFRTCIWLADRLFARRKGFDEN